MKKTITLCFVSLTALGCLLAGCTGQPPVAKKTSDPESQRKMSELGLTPKKTFNNGE
ncbi:MAG: hypothetical protein SFU56_20255 [Capsulimonadales bacterium]|nr:hypothetical protein [Capsulimonadales bacterium]